MRFGVTRDTMFCCEVIHLDSIVSCFLDTKISNPSFYPHPQPFLVSKRTFGRNRFSQHQEKGAYFNSRDTQISCCKPSLKYSKGSLESNILIPQEINKTPFSLRREGSGMRGRQLNSCLLVSAKQNMSGSTP
jgi:hypothetical protein